MKYKCDMIRDLMPLCVDDAATEVSKNAVVEHIAECKDCETFYSKVISEILLTSECSVDSKGYVAIAKKIRRRKLVTKMIFSLVTFVSTQFLFYYALGYRFNSEAAASISGRLNASSHLMGNYDWGDWRFYIYNSSNSYDVVTVNKHWHGWKAQDSCLAWPKYFSDQGGIINAGCMYYWTDTNRKFGIQLFPIIVEDTEVANVEITVFNKTKTINNVIANKLTILTFENKNPKLGNGTTGYAYNAEGKIIYKLVEDEETMRQKWEKVSN